MASSMLFTNALEALTGKKIVVVEYSEHTLGQSADAEAVCYVQLNIEGARPCGVGRSHDIVQALSGGDYIGVAWIRFICGGGGLTAVNHIVSERHPCVTMKSLL